jgi:hypothetical protein
MKTALQIILVKIIAALGSHFRSADEFCNGLFIDVNKKDGSCMN